MADVERRSSTPERRSSRERRSLSPAARLFEDFLSDIGGMPELAGPFGRGRFAPPMDISEDDQNIEIAAELPGMSKDDVEITVDRGVLTLRGEKEHEEKTEERDYRRVERSYGRFERSVRLPNYADEQNANATFKDGVLTVTVPKKETAQARRLEVKEK